MIVNRSRVAIACGEAPRESNIVADAITEVGVLIAAAQLKTAAGCRLEDAVTTARLMLETSRKLDDSRS